MSDIAPLGRPQITAFHGGAGPVRPVSGPAAEVNSRGQDRVELSSRAQLLAQLREVPDVRQDLVDEVRAEIAAGTYETDEKLDAAIESLFDDLA